MLLSISGCECENDQRGDNQDIGFGKNLSKVEFEGHQYIIYKDVTGPTGGIIHSMNCQCLKAEK